MFPEFNGDYEDLSTPYICKSPPLLSSREDLSNDATGIYDVVVVPGIRRRRRIYYHQYRWISNGITRTMTRQEISKAFVRLALTRLDFTQRCNACLKQNRLAPKGSDMEKRLEVYFNESLSGRRILSVRYYWLQRMLLELHAAENAGRVLDVWPPATHPPPVWQEPDQNHPMSTAMFHAIEETDDFIAAIPQKEHHWFVEAFPGVKGVDTSDSGALHMIPRHLNESPFLWDSSPLPPSDGETLKTPVNNSPVCGPQASDDINGAGLRTRKPFNVPESQ